jgi:hypothetical protein
VLNSLNARKRSPSPAPRPKPRKLLNAEVQALKDGKHKPQTVKKERAGSPGPAGPTVYKHGKYDDAILEYVGKYGACGDTWRLLAERFPGEKPKKFGDRYSHCLKNRPADAIVVSEEEFESRKNLLSAGCEPWTREQHAHIIEQRVSSTSDGLTTRCYISCVQMHVHVFASILKCILLYQCACTDVHPLASVHMC